MGGLKGQLGTSSSFSRPSTAKEKRDLALRLQAQRLSREYFTVYYCPSCSLKSEHPSVTAAGVYFCSSCMVNYSKIIEVKEMTSYRTKGMVSSKTKVNKQKKKKSGKNKKNS